MAGTSSAMRAGGAFVELFADGTALASGLRAAEAKVKAFGKSVGVIGAAISGLGAAITTPLLGAAKSFADAGSALNDMSVRTGVSVETLSALGYAANQTGTDMETVEGAFRFMSKAIAKGTEENLQAEASFAALGLSAKRLEQLSPEQAFGVVSKQIAKIPNEIARATTTMNIFGKSGTSLAGMINDLDALTNEAKAFGLVWTGDEAKKADALGDAFDLLKAVLGRVVTAVGGELAPLLTDVAMELARGAKYAIDFAKANGPLIVTAFKVGVAIAAAGAANTGLGVAIYGVGAAFGVLATLFVPVTAAFGLLVTILGLLFNPITLLVGGLAGLAASFLLFTDSGKQALKGLADAGGAALKWLGGRFNELKATAMTAFGGIADALKAGDIGLAVKVLWAGVNVVWLQGTSDIRAIVQEWGDWIATKFDSVYASLASTGTSAWAGLQAIWEVGTSAIARVIIQAGGAIWNAWRYIWDTAADATDQFVANTVRELIDLVTEIKTKIAIAKGFLTFSKSSHEIRGIQEEGEKLKADNEKTRAGRAAGREVTRQTGNEDTGKLLEAHDKAHEERLAAIGQNELDIQQQIADEQKAAASARIAAAQAAGAAGAEGLKKAQDELARLVAESKDKAAGATGAFDKSKGGPEGEGDLTPKGLDKAIDKTKAKISVAGSFAATSAQGLGAGDTVAVAEKQLDEQKKTNDHLKSLNKKASKKQAAFV